MSSSGGEMRGFVFSVVFIIVFASFLSSVPTGLQGIGTAPDNVIPVDPQFLAGFDETINYTRTSYSIGIFDYALGTRDWRAYYYTAGGIQFLLAAKVYVLGLWLGHSDPCKFISSNGTDRGTYLGIDEIETDSEGGIEKYSMLFTTTGEDAGSLVIYWNTTLYSDPEDAWDNDVLYLLHGLGFSATMALDIGSLLVSLLFLQLPDVPVLVNVLIATPMWACIIFVLWFVIKETMPFV